jgi:ferredoxin
LPHGKQVLKAFPAPVGITLPLEGAVPAKGLKKGRPVARGEVLAETAEPFRPDLASPLPGWITALDGDSVSIETDYEAGAEPVEPARLKELGPVEAAKALRRMGIKPPPAPSPGEPVVISGFDPEPGVTLARALWEDQRAALEDGLRLVARLFPGKPVVQAVPKGTRPLESMDSASLTLKLSYPWTLPPFLKKRLLHRIGRAARRAGYLAAFDPAARGVVDSRALYLLGTALRTGLAPSETPVTIQNTPALVTPGLSPETLLSLVNLVWSEGDTVVLGGMARGKAAARLDQGLGTRVEAVLLLKGGSGRPRPEGRCTLCGRCRAACPLKLPADLVGGTPQRLRPLIIQRLPQLAQCPACGLCTMACPRNIPLSALMGAAAERAS